MFHKILLPLDGSLLAERACAPAAALAHAAKASLILLRCISAEKILVPGPLVMGSYNPVWTEQSPRLAHKEALDYINHVKSVAILANLSTRTQIEESRPAETIVDTARAETVDLIVMASHGYSGVTRWVMGSVAERVLQAAPCPILVVRSSELPRHLLIALDGSPLSEAILEPAFEVARAMKCPVTLLRALEPVSYAKLQYLETIEPNLGQRLKYDAQQTAESYLRVIASTYSQMAPKIQTIVIHAHPAEAILDYGATHAVDLIAMSTHGRAGVKRWLFGSIAEKVLRAAGGCSMLIARPVPHSVN
jgi:nucleotide-binding universal stress UspA family protein